MHRMPFPHKLGLVHSDRLNERLVDMNLSELAITVLVVALLGFNSAMFRLLQQGQTHVNMQLGWGKRPIKEELIFLNSVLFILALGVFLFGIEMIAMAYFLVDIATLCYAALRVAVASFNQS